MEDRIIDVESLASPANQSQGVRWARGHNRGNRVLLGPQERVGKGWSDKLGDDSSNAESQ